MAETRKAHANFEEWWDSDEAALARKAVESGFVKAALGICFSAGRGCGLAESLAAIRVAIPNLKNGEDHA